MAHPDTEAASSPAPVSVAEKAAAFEDYIFEGEEPAPEQEEEFADIEGDELEIDVEEGIDEESEEQVEEPAIDAPVSLNAEEKAVFAQLPPEAQQAWSDSETRRNTQVQEATTAAKEAQRSAEQKAAQVEQQVEARFGEQLRQYTANFAPQEPNPANYADMGKFQRDKAIYDHEKAQHDQLMQQISVIGVETDEQKAQRIQKRDAEIQKLPVFAEAEDQAALVKSAMNLAVECGYEASDLAKNMDATDFAFLAQSAKWKADSEELANIKSKAGKRRRDKNTGRYRSLKPGAAPQPQSRSAKVDKAFERVKAAGGNKQRQGEAAADWFEIAGYL